MSLNRSDQRNIWGVIALSIICFLIGGAFLIPIPYFAIGPGKVVEVGPLVTVGKEKGNEEGSFRLTTISMKQGAPVDLLLSRWTSTTELIPEEHILAEDEDKRDYQRRQTVNMRLSQNQAIVAAFRHAKRPVSQKVLGVEVERVLKEGTTSLKEGDVIKRIDGEPVASTQQLISRLSRKRAGERVALTLLRNGKEMRITASLVPLRVEPGSKPRAGLGIVPVEKVEVKTTPPTHIDAQEIGGPSAGLMFALEVLNRLVPEDLTRGYRIAGTGTITADGEVGQIGGIQHKVVAADKAGMDLFFCPKDIRPEDQNEKTAKQTVKRLGIKMRVIPVSDLDEAVQALKKLPPREQASFKSKTLTGVA
jgi:Lon-like protease